jgi:hypothetical protein
VTTTTGILRSTSRLGTLANVGSGVLTVDTTEVTEGLTGTTGTLNEDGLGTSWALKSQLIEGQATTTGGGDAGTSRLREAEGSNCDLGRLEVTTVNGKNREKMLGNENFIDEEVSDPL